VIDDAAKQLGVEPEELSAALKQALENRIDEAVEAGRLTKEQGEALRERLDSAGAPLVLGGFGDRRGPGLGGFGRFGHFGPAGYFGKLEAAASYLGLDEEELRERLAEGKSMADVARAEGKSVDGLVGALVAEAEGRIDDALADGRLTEEQANRLKQALEERLTELVNREPGSRGGIPGHRFGPRFGEFHHEPRSGGPSA
jgi:polyhydroxyalkanoate synthesis regulator phasin